MDNPKRAGAARRASRPGDDLPRRVLDNLLEGCQVIGPDFRYLYVNDAVARHGRTTRRRLLGRRMMEVYPGIESTEMFSVLRRCMDERTVSHMENEFSFPDGSKGWFELRFAPVPEGVAILSVDISDRKRKEAILRASEERLNLLVDGVSDHALFLLDAEGRVASWNRGAERLKGWTEQEILGQPFSRFYTAEAQGLGEPEQMLARAALEGRAEAEGWRMRKDGSRFWGGVVLTALRDDSGRLRGFAKVTRDLTERRRVEEAQQASEERFRSTFEHAPIGMALVAPDGRWLRVNRALCEIVGYSEAELLSRTFQDITHPDDLDADLAQVRKMLAGELRTYQKEKRYVRKTGELVWVLLTVSLVRDQQGHPVHFISQIQDITDRKRAEETLRQSEAKYRTTVGNIPGLVYRAFPDWTAEFLGDTRAISGYTIAELNALEGAWRSVIHRADRDAVERDGAALLQRPASLVQTYRIVTKDGGVRWVEDRKTSRFTPAGTLEEIQGIVLDVTERKLLEDQFRQAQKMEAVGQLTGGIAHDFNNILTVIIGNAEVLAGALPEDAELREDLAELLAAAKRGATMVSRLLQFSRRGILTMNPVRLGAVVGNLSALVRRLLPATIRFEVADATGESDIVMADTGAVEQILVNLCTNARDAMPQGGALRIACQRTWLDEGYHATHPWVGPGDYVMVSVTDSGTGMDEETKGRMFEPFFTTKPASVGTGLGMAMVYGLMKQQNGMVHVYSQPGQGTTMKLYFPLAAGAAGAAGAPESAAPRRVSDPRQIAGGTETILLAEDEAPIRRTTRRALEGKGYKVLVAEDGEEALELYERHKDTIALVISDLVMPNLGGRQLAEALREAGSRVPILFTSGYSSAAAAQATAFPVGVAFLQKPWTLTDLFERVRALLDA